MHNIPIAPAGSNVTVPSAANDRLPSIQNLRGVAALSVCIYHFCTNPNIDVPDVVRSLASFSQYGVHVFFVISGFVLPYSLYAGRYHLRHFWRFLAKRAIRIEPPYLCAIVVGIVASFLSATLGFGGISGEITVKRIMLHIGYAIPFSDEQWLNPVFWTLAIEFQFYILIGLIWLAIMAPSTATIFFVVCALAAPFFDERLIGSYLPIFGVGTVLFMRHVLLLTTRHALALSALLLVSAAVSRGVPAAGAALLAFLLIQCWTAESSVTLGLGAVSYPLYLLHVPIGNRIINLSSHFPDFWGRSLLAVVGAICASLAAAWVLHRTVEEPCRRAAAFLRYGERS